jgi:FixJ family two-component response regulator
MHETANATVMVVDDDWAVREAIHGLLRSVGFAAEIYPSLTEFLARGSLPDTPCCLVLDVRLPGISGLEFQSDLVRRKVSLPIVFITGHGDIPMSVRAMKGGAIEFLTKPFRDQDLLDAIHSGLERDRQRREADRGLSELLVRFGSLSPREQEVMGEVVLGLMNRQIATHLGIAEITVKVHRGQVMRKMGAASVVDLARMADRLGLDGDLRDPASPAATRRVAP